MKITRILVSGSSIAAMLLSQTGTAFAYRDATPPLPTTNLRQHTELREDHNTHPLVDFANMNRELSEQDLSGRSILMRSLLSLRTGQRNYRRHILGRARGYDYRVLNVSGDMRRTPMARRDLPGSIVQTGGRSVRGYRDGHPTSRAIRSGALNDNQLSRAPVFGVNKRDRNILNEMEQGV